MLSNLGSFLCVLIAFVAWGVDFGKVARDVSRELLCFFLLNFLFREKQTNWRQTGACCTGLVVPVCLVFEKKVSKS